MRSQQFNSPNACSAYGRPTTHAAPSEAVHTARQVAGKRKRLTNIAAKSQR
jgi:hypothetical protein